MNFTIIGKDDSKSMEIISKLKDKIKLKENSIHPDIVIAVGGDGTFIRAVHQYPNAIFFGIHTGHLGFYANYTSENIDLLIEDINQGQYQIEKLDVLNVEMKTKNQTIQDIAINEMTIITPPRTLILDVFIDEKKLETFRGTGFCVSTCYGSTAYNKSLHGAVLDPELKAYQLTEIAGLNSNQYRTLSSPLVLSEQRNIKFQSEQLLDVYLTIDNKSYSLTDFQQACVQLNKGKIQLAHHFDCDFVERIKRTFL